MILARRTRRKSAKMGGFLGAPGTAMGTAQRAQEDEVREEARRHILELGELLGRSAIQPAGGTATATAKGKQPPTTVPLCFFNPLHGISARHVAWRPLGQWRAITVRSCD